MTHFFFIDPLEKLNFKKDSSLMWALTLQEQGVPVRLLFPADFYYQNKSAPIFKVFDFAGAFDSDGIYLKKMELKASELLAPGPGDTIHMRLDPPFDTRYLRTLWMLRALKNDGVRVVNDPDGILLHNEKLCALEKKNSLASYIGSSSDGLRHYLKSFTAPYNLIMKPLDLYQGMGVEKIEGDVEAVVSRFVVKVQECQGPVIVQPFDKSVTKGETRALYFKGKELGSILKVPPEGKFLANIAQGASFRPTQLSQVQKELCQEVASELSADGVDFLAFDLLGDNLSEVNVTCPGLLVEVSKAHGKNLALEMLKFF